MNASAVLAALHQQQIMFYMLRSLQLTGYEFSPPAQLSNELKFDYIIVGGGTAGCTIATRLAQKTYKVLMIEAGTDSPYEAKNPGLVQYLQHSRTDWNWTSTKDNSTYQCHNCDNVKLDLGKVIGGSSEVSYMVYARGHPFIYDQWALITEDPKWAYPSLLPYFKKAEAINDTSIEKSDRREYFGYKGYIGVTRVEEDASATDKILEAFKKAGKRLIPDIDGIRVGYAKGLVTINNGERQGTGERYIYNVRNNPYILIAKSTLATKILFDKNNRAYGVEVITDENKNVTVIARREIIITCGAIGTPKLLLQSGIGPKKQLKKFDIPVISDLPVGKNLQDHVAVLIPFKTNFEITNKSPNPGKFPTGLIAGYESLDDATNIIDRSLLRIPDYQILMFAIDREKFLVEFCLTAMDYPVEICDELDKASKKKQVLMTLLGNMSPKSRGEVRLRSTDPMDSPIVELNTFKNETDLEDMVKYVKHFLKTVNSTAFKELGLSLMDLTAACGKCDNYERESDEFHKCHILKMMISLRHFAGTCAMGTVVDDDLAVKNVTGLYIGDASVMPLIPSANIEQAVVMLGEVFAYRTIKRAGDYNNQQHEKIPVSEVKNMPNDNDL